MRSRWDLAWLAACAGLLATSSAAAQRGAKDHTEAVRQRIELALVTDESPTLLASEEDARWLLGEAVRFAFDAAGPSDTVRSVRMRHRHRRAGSELPEHLDEDAHALAAALDEGLERLALSAPDGTHQTLILVSALPRAADKPQAKARLASLLPRISQLRSRKISLVSVAVGAAVDRGLIAELAEKAKGRFYAAQGLAQLFDILSHTMHALLGLKPKLSQRSRRHQRTFPSLTVTKSTPALELIALVPGGEKIKLMLVDPQGAPLRPLSKGSYHRIFCVLKPQPGTWTLATEGYERAALKLRAYLHPPASNYTSPCAASQQASLALYGEREEKIFVFEPPAPPEDPGEAMQLRATAAGRQLPSAPSLEVTVTRPDGSEDHIQLERVGQREYASSYTPEGKAEDYRYELEAPQGSKVAPSGPSRATEIAESYQKRHEDEADDESGAAPTPAIPAWVWALAAYGVLLLLSMATLVWVLLTRGRPRRAKAPKTAKATASTATKPATSKQAPAAEVVVPKEIEDAFLKPKAGGKDTELTSAAVQYLKDATYTFTTLAAELGDMLPKRAGEVKALNHEGGYLGATQSLRYPAFGGTLGIICDQAGATVVTRAMLDLDAEDEVDRELADEALRELMNLFSGQLKQLPEAGVAEISLPETLKDAAACAGGAYQLLHFEGGGQLALLWKAS